MLTNIDIDDKQCLLNIDNEEYTSFLNTLWTVSRLSIGAESDASKVGEAAKVIH